MDFDDHALILPPPDAREVVQTISGSGMPITDVRLKGFEPQSNHSGGGFFGAKAVGENFGALLAMHPPYVDPDSGLLGGYYCNFGSYRKVHWNPDFSYDHLKEEQDRYKLLNGIGAGQHFCQDLSIGLSLGYGGLLTKIEFYMAKHAPAHADFYDGLESIVRGMQSWIGRSAAEAHRQAASEPDDARRQNLTQMAELNERLVSSPPQTFREACQWIAWYQMAARMFNGSGSLAGSMCCCSPSTIGTAQRAPWTTRRPCSTSPACCCWIRGTFNGGTGPGRRRCDHVPLIPDPGSRPPDPHSGQRGRQRGAEH